MESLGKKIKIVTYANFPYGGASANYLRYFALALSREGHNVEVILPTGNYFGKKIDINTSQTGYVEGIRFKHISLKAHPSSLIGKLFANIIGLLVPILYFVKDHFKTKFEVIVLYNLSFSKLIVFLFVKLMLKKKLIVIVPEYYEKPLEKFSISRIKWYSFYFGFKYLLKYSDGFIVFSSFLKNTLSKILKEEKEILIVPNLLDPIKFNNIEDKPFIYNKTTIGYTGTPTRKDGISDLLKSFSVLNKKYCNLHLLIIGDVIGVNKSVILKLQNEARILGINAENITFTGLVSHSRIPELLKSCQILALTRPSGIFAKAGFPTKLGEYFACEKPVLVTRVGDILTYFQDEKHVVFAEPDNIESIVKGFEKLINNKELREHIVKNAYNWMENNLNYINLSKKISNYINLIAIN